MGFVVSKNIPVNNNQFFLSYGGPGGCWFTEDDVTRKNILMECKKQYAFWGKQRVYEWKSRIKNIDVIVYKIGVHRAISLKYPTGFEANHKALDRYFWAKFLAKQFDTKEAEKKYRLLSYNCVTAVATILNCLDPTIVEKNLSWPWNLDRHLEKESNKYCKYIYYFLCMGIGMTIITLSSVGLESGKVMNLFCTNAASGVENDFLISIGAVIFMIGLVGLVWTYTSPKEEIGDTQSSYFELAL
jgi:hypothetical protein